MRVAAGAYTGAICGRVHWRCTRDRPPSLLASLAGALKATHLQSARPFPPSHSLDAIAAAAGVAVAGAAAVVWRRYSGRTKAAVPQEYTGMIGLIRPAQVGWLHKQSCTLRRTAKEAVRPPWTGAAGCR